MRGGGVGGVPRRAPVYPAGYLWAHLPTPARGKPGKSLTPWPTEGLHLPLMGGWQNCSYGLCQKNMGFLGFPRMRKLLSAPRGTALKS